MSNNPVCLQIQGLTMMTSPSAYYSVYIKDVKPFSLVLMFACLVSLLFPISLVAAQGGPVAPDNLRGGNGLSGPILITEQEQAWLDRKHTVRVRIADSPPYQIATPEPQGISVDYLKLIGKRFGINFVFVINKSINWEKAVKDLTGDHQWLDLVVAIKRTPEREKVIAFTDDYLSSPWVIVNRTDSNFVSRIHDLYGKKVAVEKGFLVKDLIEKEYPQIAIIPFTTSLEALQSVASGGSDAYIANLAIASYLIRDKGLTNLKIAAPTPFGSHDQAMGVRKDWPELAGIISKALVAMSDAEEREIRNRWLSIRYEYGINMVTVLSWIAGLTAVFLLLIGMVMFWNRRLKQEIDLRIKAEGELIQSANEWQSTFDSINDSVALIDAEQRVIRCNKSTKVFLRREYSGILGHFCWQLFHDADAPISDCPISRSRLSLHSETTTIRHQDRWLEVTVDPILSDKRVMTGWVHVVRDVTERKHAEESLREMQVHMLQNDKLATIGQLAAGVAHEINNPMGFVGSNMATLAKYIDKYNSYIAAVEKELCSVSSGGLPEQIQEIRNKLKLDYIIRDISGLVDENNEGIDRVRRIVQDLRTFSRADSSNVDLADLNSCIDSTVNIIINEIKYAAELKRDYGDLPKVPCNSQQINQVFMNLVMNAAHAIQNKGEEVGEIVIRTWADKDYAFVSVSDTGCGIEPDNWRKIFDAFYTTKEIGKGTGLGLSISSGIIRKHGGEITLSSEVGIGSTFTVRLPLNPAHLADGEPQ